MKHASEILQAAPALKLTLPNYKPQDYMKKTLPDKFYNFLPEKTMAEKYSEQNIKNYCNCSQAEMEECKKVETPRLSLTKMALEYSFFSQLV